MKALALSLALVLGLAGIAHASSSKVCFGLGDAKGKKYTVIIAPNKLILSGDEWEGSHKFRGIVQGRDGIDYLEYAMKGEEGDHAALVNEALLKAGTTGLMKFRSRGEGFNEEKFFCRDSN